MAYDRNLPYNDLPPLPPKADIETGAVYRALAQAHRYLGELKGLCATLPDPHLLIQTLVLQESRDSSAIENIVTTQDELFAAAAQGEDAAPAAKEVLRYREALYLGLERMRENHNLLRINTIINIVQCLKGNAAGIRNTPGTALRTANTKQVIYTPPCCEDVIQEKLSELERFINDERMSNLDPLIKMALIHYQFESIHPFMDGNGRTGRILNALYLVQHELLQEPVLYLSAYILQNRADYYRLLREVTEKENWEEWLLYNLTAISETAQLSAYRIRRILALRDEMSAAMKDVLKGSYSHDLLNLLFMLPYTKVEILAQRGIAHRITASKYLQKLAEADLLRTEKRGRTTYYVNWRLMEVLGE